MATKAQLSHYKGTDLTRRDYLRLSLWEGSV